MSDGHPDRQSPNAHRRGWHLIGRRSSRSACCWPAPPPPPPTLAQAALTACSRDSNPPTLLRLATLAPDPCSRQSSQPSAASGWQYSQCSSAWLASQSLRADLAGMDSAPTYRACQQLVQATNACLDGADLTCACNTETVSGFVTCATCAPAIYQGESDSLRSAVEREFRLLNCRTEVMKPHTASHAVLPSRGH